ncbi:hypothetical protein OAK38_02310 [Verrucomicrobia bacterium]|nr:hypothetical protein [Verrucomicrobiota bacterium]
MKAAKATRFHCLRFGTTRTIGTRLGTGTRLTNGTNRTGLERFTLGGLLTRVTVLGKGALGANLAFLDTGALGALGALVKLEYRGTERTWLTDGARGACGTGRYPHTSSPRQRKVRTTTCLDHLAGKFLHRIFIF